MHFYTRVAGLLTFSKLINNFVLCMHMVSYSCSISMVFLLSMISINLILACMLLQLLTDLFAYPIEVAGPMNTVFLRPCCTDTPKHTNTHTHMHTVYVTYVTFSCTQSLQQGTFVTEEKYTELSKAQFAAHQSKMMEMFDDLVKKLGCKENKTLMSELGRMFSTEVQPLRESFQQVYSKVFAPQIEKIDVSYTCTYSLLNTR